MKIYHVNKGAGLVGLTIKEHDVPVPGPLEVLVRVFSFDDARVAHQYFAEHSHFGKVVISQS